MKKNEKKSAFTFIEVMSSMIIIGFLFVISAFGIKKLSANTNMSRFKKGYASVEKTVAGLLQNKAIYGSYRGFKDVKPAELTLSDSNGKEDLKIGEVIGANQTDKFRDAFKYSLNVIKDNVDCKLYNGTSPDGCFMSEDGIVFGIPDTNFKDIGVIEIPDPDDRSKKLTVTPITMYVDNKSITSPEADAIIIGVEYDGNLHFIRTYNNCENDSNRIQCNLDFYVNAKSIGDSGDN